MNIYKIFVATYEGWILEGETHDREMARATVKLIRSSGRAVLIELNGKKLKWRV